MAKMFRGHPACSCLIAWLPVYEAELLRRGVIKKSIDIYQLIGGAKASGGTHTKGGAFDIAQTSDEAIAVARQMGADATWHRPHNWDGRGGMEHTHGVLRGCPHNGPARYQITAVDAGFNGLGHLGRGGKDTGPRPLSKRTWWQGITWAKSQAGAELTVFTQNVHVGEGIQASLADTVHHLDPDIVLLQEVTEAKWDDLERLFGKTYHLVPDPAHAVGRMAHQTPVLMKRSRFELLSQGNPQVSAWLGGGRHGRLWPTRFRTMARARDKVTGRVVVPHSVHTWAAWTTNRSAKAGHLAQLAAVAASIARRQPAAVVLAGGDWNEDLRNPDAPARRTLAKVLAYPAQDSTKGPLLTTSHKGRSVLDDVFVRRAPFVSVVSRKRINTPHTDHYGVLVTLAVRPKGTTR